MFLLDLAVSRCLDVAVGSLKGAPAPCFLRNVIFPSCSFWRNINLLRRSGGRPAVQVYVRQVRVPLLGGRGALAAGLAFLSIRIFGRIDLPVFSVSPTR